MSDNFVQIDCYGTFPIDLPEPMTLNWSLLLFDVVGINTWQEEHIGGGGRRCNYIILKKNEKCNCQEFIVDFFYDDQKNVDQFRLFSRQEGVLEYVTPILQEAFHIPTEIVVHTMSYFRGKPKCGQSRV